MLHAVCYGSYSWIKLVHKAPNTSLTKLYAVVSEIIWEQCSLQHPLVGWRLSHLVLLSSEPSEIIQHRHPFIPHFHGNYFPLLEFISLFSLPKGLRFITNTSASHNLLPLVLWEGIGIPAEQGSTTLCIQYHGKLPMADIIPTACPCHDEFCCSAVSRQFFYLPGSIDLGQALPVVMDSEIRAQTTQSSTEAAELKRQQTAAQKTPKVNDPNGTFGPRLHGLPPK